MRLHPLRSRAAWVLFIPVLAFSSAGNGAPDSPVLVVWTSGVQPFEEAVNGLRAGFSSADTLSFIDLKSPSAEAELAQVSRRGSPRLTIAVGVSALTAATAQHWASPILATMVLRSDAASAVASAPPGRLIFVYLDVPPADVMAQLRALFPGKSRLGMIRNPSRDGTADPLWQAQARQQGFITEVRECSSPESLLKSFLSLKRKVDFVLLQPDSSLYNDATARPLLMASIENQLPVIGFSASFVRAGAAVGVYPDFNDIGLQTADLGRRYLATQPSSSNETPRKLVFAANQGVLRLLGLEHRVLPNYPVVGIK